MQILRARGPLPGFKAIELGTILPGIIDLGEHRETANHRYREHAQNHWVLEYVIEGTSRVRIDGEPEVSLEAGSIACFPPNLGRWWQYGPEPKHHVLWVGFELQAIQHRYPEWKLSQALQRVHFAHDLMHLERVFLQVIREATTPSLHQACGLRLALDTLVLEVVRAFTEPRKILSLVSVHPAIAKGLGILETRFRKNWTLSELADEVGLSRSRLAELFNLEVGYSIHKFLTKVRVRHAETLLSHSDLQIGDIASECGFATIQHFSRVFKGVTGQSPINFRRRCADRDSGKLMVSSKHVG
ncbi:MAG: helix-turn-helix transcriptional regulator [Verrucomicrobia bacterium]|nr:helix-turn-helix transcriptional regulator [Verrucomicrobiota bacterium]